MSKTNWKPEDFEGSGHYVVRTETNPNGIKDDGFLTTVLYKVGYVVAPQRQYGLISMADGWSRFGDIVDREFIPFKTVQDLCDSMNSAQKRQRYRPATKEEVLRVIKYSSKRYIK